MYSYDSRIRFSETDPNGFLTLNRLVDYFQDCCIFHSEDVGLGMKNTEDKHKVWMLLGWQIEIHRLPEFTENVTISTWPYSFVRIKGGRNFTMTDEAGNELARADSQWVYMNLETGMPERIPDDFGARFGLGEPLEMAIDKKRLRMPEDCEEREAFPVRKEHLDTNHHVNNGQYIMIALNLLPENIEVHQVKVEYKSQAKLGDVIIPRVKSEDDNYLVALCNEEKQPYALIEIR